ncbi:hypothetical protein LAZ67_X004507 [Cordylochernes scorpioides]|uniref:Transposase n=1 Tax=Cordylochernes scorpioides TaxID=51811 RepID=A0ABY6LXP6_9ARAC|nr:hypothetical protein LAZ67_X004507 [Cordylochernes scorpioides]
MGAAFILGRISTEDEHRAGRPVERMTVRQIEETLGIPKTTVDHIMREHLGLMKLSARWVPKPLTPDQKALRRKVSSDNLALFEANPEEFVNRFVTMDETWAHHFTPESKLQSMQLRHSGSPPPKKAKTVPSAGKVMRPVTLPYIQGMPNALNQQDDTRLHTARISQQALQEKSNPTSKCKVFLLCTKCNSQPATPRHIIDCIDSSIDELYSSPADTIKMARHKNEQTILSKLRNKTRAQLRQDVISFRKLIDQVYVVHAMIIMQFDFALTSVPEPWLIAPADAGKASG